TDTYRNLSDLLIKQGRIPEAQAVLELLKLKEINTYTRDTKLTSKGISFTPAEQKALDEFLTTYSTAATFAQELSRCAETQCPKLAQLEDQRDRINTNIREMLDRLRISLKDQVIDISKLNTAEFNNAAKAIVNAQPGTILIYPIITETKIQFLIALKASAKDKTQVVFRAIEGPTLNSEDLFATTQQFRNQLMSSSSDLTQLQATSQKLYNWLIKPLEAEINHPDIQHLVFVLDRATRHIPIAALHDGKQYLISRRQTITAVTSATGTNPAAPPPKAPSILAVGASQFKDAPALDYVEPEINAIVKTDQTPKGIFPGDRYLNTQFTFNTLKTHLEKHNILHIATHGMLDAFNIDNSHLLTSQDEKIDKSKIQLLNDYGLSNIHLVILSACNTGTGGKNSDNLEIAGISHYFMTSGAKSVIASLWQVNDPATALFMQQFYQHIQSGKTKAQALQQVQQDLISGRLTLKDADAIDGKPPTPQASASPVPSGTIRTQMKPRSPANSLAHPFYWSPFILIGNNL
ncbi:MAG: CHAT domain-containing protein, partial [Synechococcales bacterium]|nr:CHAT domain-containing protein [Synechococcales bacterium]